LGASRLLRSGNLPADLAGAMGRFVEHHPHHLVSAPRRVISSDSYEMRWSSNKAHSGKSASANCAATRSSPDCVPRPLPGYRRCAKVKPSRVASQDSKNCNDGFPASRRTYWMAFRSCSSSDCNCKPTLSERRSQVHGISQALTRLTWPPSRATARHRRSVPGHLMPLRSGAPHSTSPCARSAKTSQP
jgi:hypothetical protein